MTQAWITTSSPHIEGITNSIAAACDQGYIPDRLYLIETPGVADAVADALELATTIITAYGGDEPAIEITQIDDETEFDAIRTHIKDAIETVSDEGGEVAVDITPGRKFMSAIAFAAGFRYDADHVFYFYLQGTGFFGQSYPDMPRPACRLYDFREEL